MTRLPASSEEERWKRHASDWVAYSNVEDLLSRAQSHLIELSQRELDRDQQDRLAAMLQHSERHLLTQLRRRRRRAA